MGFTVYNSATLILIAVMVWVMLDTIKKRGRRLRLELMRLHTAVIIALLGNTLEMISIYPETKIMWNTLKFLGVVFIPPFLSLLYIRFSGVTRLGTKKNFLLINILPVITLFMVFTSPIHSLFSKQHTVVKTVFTSYIAFVPGTWFWVNSVYSYVLILVGATALIIGCLRKPTIYRGQTYVMIAGLGICFFLNILVIVGLFSDFGDVSIISFAVAGVAHYWAIMVYKPTTMIRMARSMAINDIINPVLIFDNYNLLLDANTNAYKIWGLSDTDCGELGFNSFAEQKLGLAMDTRAAANLSLDEREIHIDGDDQYDYAVSDKELRGKKGEYIGRVLVFNNITRIRSTVNRLEYILSHDFLTGLHNRHAFQQEIRNSDKTASLPTSIICCNVCGMKFINNVFGYEFGDSVIKTVADAISSASRNIDVCARVNGDEFAIMLPGMDRDQAEQICIELRNKCRRLMTESGKEGIQIELFFGAATKISTQDNIDIVLKNAVSTMNRNKMLQAQDSNGVLFKSFIDLLGKNKLETIGHVERTQRLCSLMADKLDFTEQQKANLLLLAMTHDIGMLSTAKELTSKMGSLSNEEWEEIKLHVVKGYNIASASIELSTIANDILAHHERYDGLGFPNRLRGDEIPLSVRILAVVDAYDEMVVARHPEDARTKAEAMDYLRKRSGARFDPEIVECFELIMAEVE